MVKYFIGESMYKAYKDFIAKYKDKITNIPTLDDVAKFYLDKINEIDFSDTNEVYDYLSNIREVTETEKSYNIWLPLLVDIQRDLERNGVRFVKAYGDRSFISFSNANYKHSQKDNQLKLWIDAKLNNVSKIAIKLATKIDARIQKNVFSDNVDTFETTQFKISKDFHRNDTVTIYTDYSCADQIIQDLTEMKEEDPDLFKSESRPNPFVMKINEFISYADIDHHSSYPELLSDIYQRVDGSRGTIFSLPADKRLDYVKLSVLNAIKVDLNDKKTILANPDNMASSRVDDGTLIEDLSNEQREQYVAHIDQMRMKLLEKIEPQME